MKWFIHPQEILNNLPKYATTMEEKKIVEDCIKRAMDQVPPDEVIWPPELQKTSGFLHYDTSNGNNEKY
jgi:hypothetical protein